MRSMCHSLANLKTHKMTLWKPQFSISVFVNKNQHAVHSKTFPEKDHQRVNLTEQL